jgi:hypothetical protein
MKPKPSAAKWFNQSGVFNFRDDSWLAGRESLRITFPAIVATAFPLWAGRQKGTAVFIISSELILLS